MKTIIIIIALFSVSIAHAGDKETVTETINICNSIGDAAEFIMKEKTNGVPASSLLKVVADSDEIENHKAGHVAVITEAYDTHNSMSAQEFRNNLFDRCYKIRRASRG